MIEHGRLGFWGAFFLYGGGVFFAGGALAARDWKSLGALVVASAVVGSTMGVLAIYWGRKDRQL